MQSPDGSDLEGLRVAVHRANLDLVHLGLVLFTWGNASGIDRQAGIMVIKPSGVDYERMGPEDMVCVRLADGTVLPAADGRRLVPSSDTPTHLALYRAWPTIGGIVHTHSRWATAVAQAGRGIPAQGTTHADYFRGDIPCTRALRADEVAGEYEANTGEVIRACLEGSDPLAMPGILVDQHGPFAWGANPAKAVYHAGVLERLAEMHIACVTLGAGERRIPDHLLERHYQRKHGPRATYGQR
jgi:L-ribulose-5-phosphate 4-epimerase